MQTAQRVGVLQPFIVAQIKLETRNVVLYDAVSCLRVPRVAAPPCGVGLKPDFATQQHKFLLTLTWTSS